jgi:FMN reductase
MSAPFIVGIGGTTRAGSGTERALSIALRNAEAAGATTRLFGGEFLSRLPHFAPGPGPGPAEGNADQTGFVDAIRQADGVIIATPGYHGSLSGIVKNALDTLELTRADAAPYFTGRAVGVIVTADGWQAAGTTLMAVRSVIHALRGWPTPFGAALDARTLFDDSGECRSAKDAWQLSTVAGQVMEFARMKGGS